MEPIQRGASGGSYLPAVLLRHPTAFSTTSSVDYIMIWQEAIRNLAGMWLPADPTRILIPRSGWYDVFAHFYWVGNATGLRYMKATKADGTTLVDTRHTPSVTATNGYALSTVEYFKAGESFQFIAAQDSGGNLNVSSIRAGAAMRSELF